MHLVFVAVVRPDRQDLQHLWRMLPSQKQCRIVAVEERGARMTVAREQYVSSACRRLQSSLKGNEAACVYDTLERDVPFALLRRVA